MLARHFGAACFVWNLCLRVRSEAYRDPELVAMFGKDLSIGLLELSRWFTELKKDAEAGRTWLAEIDSGVISQALRDQDAAFNNFFAGRGRYPKRKKRNGGAACRFVFDHPHTGKVKVWEADDLVLPLNGEIDAASRVRFMRLLKPVPGVDLMICGHTITSTREPVRFGSHLFIDTGAYLAPEGRLKAVDPAAGVYWQVEHREDQQWGPLLLPLPFDAGLPKKARKRRPES